MTAQEWAAAFGVQLTHAETFAREVVALVDRVAARGGFRIGEYERTQEALAVFDGVLEAHRRLLAREG